MNIKGKITWVSEVQSIRTRDNRTLLKKEAIIETQERYPQSLCFEVWGDDVQHQYLATGQLVEVDYNMHAIAYNGKYFNHAKAWKIILQEQR